MILLPFFTFLTFSEDKIIDIENDFYVGTVYQCHQNKRFLKNGGKI